MQAVKMTVGFMFCGREVLLVRKTKPGWQAGMWNGIGGKVEQGESFLQSMVREWREETGLAGDFDWRLFCTEYGPGYETRFYSCKVGERPREGGPNDAGEMMAWREVRFLPQLNVIGNLRWLIPMAQDWRGVLGLAHATDTRHIREQPTW